MLCAPATKTRKGTDSHIPLILWGHILSPGAGGERGVPRKEGISQPLSSPRPTDDPATVELELLLLCFGTKYLVPT